MAKDWGVQTGRVNSTLPSYGEDAIAEIRIDSTGRIMTRLADGNENFLSYFEDGEAVGSGAPDDRGILVLGKNDTDSNYQVLRVNDDGSLIVSLQAGTDVSAHSDKTGAFGPTDTIGEVALVLTTWTKIIEIPIATGTAHLTGWEFLSDKNTHFQVVLSDDTGTDGHDRADAVEILSSAMATSARPSDVVPFSRAKDRAGGTNIALVVWAKQLQSGPVGIASAAIDAHTTT